MSSGRALLAAALPATALLAACAFPTAPTRPAAAPSPGEVVQQVFVRVDSTSPGAVLVDTRDGGVVCVAPCLREVTVASGGTYEVLADGILPSGGVGIYSREDPAAWLVHEGATVEAFWAFRALTVTSAGLGLAFIAAGGVVNSLPELRQEHPDAALGLGIPGVLLAIPGTVVFWVLTEVYSESDLEFRDPALPGFRF